MSSPTQGEAQVKPNSMLDDNRWKAVATVRDLSHRSGLPGTSLSVPTVTLKAGWRYRVNNSLNHKQKNGMIFKLTSMG